MCGKWEVFLENSRETLCNKSVNVWFAVAKAKPLGHCHSFSQAVLELEKSL